MLFDPLSYREVGKYPISIGTSLAIESITGIHDDYIGKVDVLNHDCLWLNIRTLLRNMFGAMQTATGPTPSFNEYAECIASEIETITQIVSDVSMHRCKVMTYYSNYSDVERKHKGATLRADSTDKQKASAALNKQVLMKLFTIIKDQAIPFTGINDLITGQPASDNLIMTHNSYDLLANSSTFKLTLVESHTGAVKTKALWHTKYLDGRNLPMIPFNRMFLQVFGDKEMFRPMDIKLRKEVIEIATKYRWNSNTSMSMITYGLSQMKNHYASDIILKLHR